MGEATLGAITAAMMDALDARIREEGTGSDIGEMAALSAAEALQSTVRHQLDDLFGQEATTPDRVEEVLAGLGRPEQFAILARAMP